MDKKEILIKLGFTEDDDQVWSKKIAPYKSIIVDVEDNEEYKSCVYLREYISCKPYEKFLGYFDNEEILKKIIDTCKNK